MLSKGNETLYFIFVLLLIRNLTSSLWNTVLGGSVQRSMKYINACPFFSPLLFFFRCDSSCEELNIQSA